ncbi:MAG: diphosphomevalonate decarboxylase [Wenzhouxiangella sp.]|nr:MAG: diphosphomevalonate decarboxylase [Wenzhouxiangella sp.]
MTVQSAAARAGANIALVKYWGKRDARLNLPAAGSISVTLSALVTETRLDVIGGGALTPSSSLADELYVNGQPAAPERVSAVLDLMRQLAGGGPAFRVESRNNFPTGAGLASSASAFAALVVAADRALNLSLPPSRLSELARRGSGSAARSIFGGFVEMLPGHAADGSDAVARPLTSVEDWPLEVVVAITETGPKAVSSTDGMNLTMRTSPYYPAWVESVAADLDTARQAIADRDFERLAEVGESSALKMHASALAAQPGLIYWNPATLACMQAIRELRAAGTGAFFTVDAGPQVKAICLPEAAAVVSARLAEIPGVARVVGSGLGQGAEVQA